MPDITLSIPFPVLNPGEKFKTRYKLLPAGAFTSNVDRTNAPFTLTGLAVGSYVMEIIYVNQLGQDCRVIFKPFEVIDPGTCKAFSVQIVSGTAANKLEISYTGAGTFPNGFAIDYYPLPNGVAQTAIYNPLPASPVNISIPKGFDYHVRIRGLYAAGEYEVCFEDDIERPAEPCTAAVINSISITPIALQANGDYLVTVNMNITNSIPGSTILIINGTQQNVLLGYPPATFAATLPTTGLTTVIYTQNVYARYQTSAGTPKLAPIYKIKFAGVLIYQCDPTTPSQIPFTVEVDL